MSAIESGGAIVGDANCVDADCGSDDELEDADEYANLIDCNESLLLLTSDE